LHATFGIKRNPFRALFDGIEVQARDDSYDTEAFDPLVSKATSAYSISAGSY
jgi:hypothetical protein